MSYPKYKYHKTEEPMIVMNEAEEKSLGVNFKDSPADFGVITAPSEEQAREIRMKALAHAAVEVAEEPKAHKSHKPK